jgi:hypothetical protein
LSRNLDKNVFIENNGYIYQGFPVGKKPLLAIAIISVLLFSAAAGTKFVKMIKANPIAPPSNTIIEISSPQNVVYYTNTITLNFTVARNGWMSSVAYSIDGGGFGMVPNFTEISREPMPPMEPTGELWQLYNWTRYTFMGGKVISGLSEGNHSVSVYYGDFDEKSTNKRFQAEYGPVTVYFVIDTSPPEIRILSAGNETYNTTDFPLNFTVNKEISWMSYRLDNGANITIDGNTTLTGLAEGTHNIVIYANDTAGNSGASETIMFTIAKTEFQPEIFPTVVVIAPIALVTVIGAGLLVYFKKRNQ